MTLWVLTQTINSLFSLSLSHLTTHSRQQPTVNSLLSFLSQLATHISYPKLYPRPTRTTHLSPLSQTRHTLHNSLFSYIHDFLDIIWLSTSNVMNLMNLLLVGSRTYLELDLLLLLWGLEANFCFLKLWLHHKIGDQKDFKD